jgi:hypothetical protein
MLYGYSKLIAGIFAGVALSTLPAVSTAAADGDDAANTIITGAVPAARGISPWSVRVLPDPDKNCPTAKTDGTTHKGHKVNPRSGSRKHGGFPVWRKNTEKSAKGATTFSARLQPA